MASGASGVAERRGGPPVRRVREKQPPSPVRAVTFGQINHAAGHRVVIYGPGGAGKTSLAALAPGPVAIFDLEDSLPRLWPQLSTIESPPTVLPVAGVENWQALRDTLNAPGWDEVRTIVIDSATKAEEFCLAHTLATVPHEKDGVLVRRIEDYGYGKGYQHNYETFLAHLGDLDRHCRAGRNVVLIAHDCVNSVPNPSGEDWVRYEPRLQSPSSGKASIRLRVREWADHVFFIGYDVAVSKDGKASGCGTRALYPAELPFCMAKSRTLADVVPLEKHDRLLWELLFAS